MPKLIGPVLLLTALVGLIAADKAQPPGQLRHLHFSWDGKHVLAQDDSEITVLAVQPFDILFRIPAKDATTAQFTPDSREIVFVSSITHTDSTRFTIVHETPHVERWNVQDQARAESTATPGLTCGTVALSPDGDTLACDDFEETLSVIDVSSGEKAFEKTKFVQPFAFRRWDAANPLHPELPGYDPFGDLGAARLEFSPDGRFLLAVPGCEGAALIWDVSTRRLLRLERTLNILNRKTLQFYDFIAPNRLLISKALWGRQYVGAARIVAFPEGSVVSTAKIPLAGRMVRAASPAFIVVFHPYYKVQGNNTPGVGGGAVAVELSTGQMITSDTPALDVFGAHYVAEVRPGEVGLYERGKGLQASVVLDKK